MRFNPPLFIGTIALFFAIVAAVLFGYLLSQFIQGLLPVDVLTFLITLFLLVSIVLLIYGLFLLVKKQQSPPSPRSIADDDPFELPLEAPFVRRRRLAKPLQTLAAGELQSRLIGMLAGDRAAAERLVDEVKRNFPSMPENWYWEKAIQDLERDRR